MLKLVFLAILAIAPVWSDQSDLSVLSQYQYPYTLYKAYPQSSEQVDYLKRFALSEDSSKNPLIFLTPIGQGKTAYVLIPGNSSGIFANNFLVQHIPFRKVEVSSIQRATFDNSMHLPLEFPPKQSGQKNNKKGYIISSPRVTNWGIWGNWTQCSAGQYVVGMKLRTEASQGRQGDDTALNAIELFCAKPQSHEYTPIKSLEGNLGTWGRPLYCPQDSHVVGFQLRSEVYQGGGPNDDTAGNNLRIFCNSPSGQMVEGDGTSWGDWTDQQYCLNGQAVVGFRTQVEPHQINGDDTALNNLEMVCQDQINTLCYGPGYDCGGWAECCSQNCYQGSCQ